MSLSLLFCVLVLLLCHPGDARRPSLSTLLSSKRPALDLLTDDDLQLAAPYSLPSDVVPGQLNYFNFTRPEGLREFYLYVPTRYNTSVTWPFAFYFHGYGTGPPLQNGYHQGIYLNMTVDADAAGYLIAFGQGTPSSSGFLSWDAGRCCKGYNSTMVRVDDVAYTRTAIKMIEAVVKVDPTRRYAMGWSNGGMITERLACEAHDLFAGICADASSVVIGADAQSGHAACDTSFGRAQLDMIHFSGTADTAVPWTGSAWQSPQGVPSAPDDMAHWNERLGCGPRFRQTYNDGIFGNLVWECRGNTTLEWMTVRNGQHQWWTRTVAPAFPFETTQYVLRFFTRNWMRRIKGQ